jgi:ParB/RepB/Spo0J family partition protein
LTASVAAVGVVEPLVVSPATDDSYVIVAGHRRYAAAKAAGLAKVPCTIRTLSDAERIEIMLVENLQRSDLSPIEEASGYFKLVEHGLSQRDMARRIGRSVKHVASRLALLELPKHARDELQAGTLTVRDGQSLLELRERPELIDRILSDELTRHNVERAVLREQHQIETADATSQRDNEGSRDRRSDPHAEECTRARARASEKTARVAFAQGLIARRLPKADAHALVASQILADLSAAHAKTACRILEIEALEGQWGPDYRGAVAAFAALSTTNRERALLAGALAIGEEAVHHNQGRNRPYGPRTTGWPRLRH